MERQTLPAKIQSCGQYRRADRARLTPSRFSFCISRLLCGCVERWVEEWNCGGGGFSKTCPPGGRVPGGRGFLCFFAPVGTPGMGVFPPPPPPIFVKYEKMGVGGRWCPKVLKEEELNIKV